ncbi:hypothetical protein ACUTFY_33085, partial [Burkholderia pseudomallei]|uniref:hypothetical protein n=1 Tax=Burkholderia pseudomallei TaxID=28450 RepID=UPI004043A993
MTAVFAVRRPPEEAELYFPIEFRLLIFKGKIFCASGKFWKNRSSSNVTLQNARTLLRLTQDDVQFISQHLPSGTLPFPTTLEYQQMSTSSLPIRHGRLMGFVRSGRRGRWAEATGKPIIDDGLWARIEPLLPPPKPRRFR